MKIGILSLVPDHNYGGILQSYALQTVLERMGHEVKVITKEPSFKEEGWLKYLKYGVRIVRKYILRTQKNLPIKREKYYRDKRFHQLHNTLAFVDKYLHLRYINQFSDIKEGEFDAFVVGSDQVWRPKYFNFHYHSVIENAFLKFAENWNMKRISYAASFGVDVKEYTKSQIRICGSLLRKFDVVSVREYSGIDLCKEMFHVAAVKACDPTMLLTKDDYMRLVDEHTPKSTGNLLVYCLDKNELLDKVVSDISIRKKLTPFYTNEDTNGVKPPIESWLRAFNDAEIVVTDSFHACVFSIIFKKTFVVIGNRDRGMSRFESLLNEFEMKDRLIMDYADFSEELIDLPLVDTDCVLNKQQSLSIEILKHIE